MGSNAETRSGDIPWYVTDTSAVQAATGWRPRTGKARLVGEIVDWLRENAATLKRIL